MEVNVVLSFASIRSSPAWRSREIQGTPPPPCDKGFKHDMGWGQQLVYDPRKAIHEILKNNLLIGATSQAPAKWLQHFNATYRNIAGPRVDQPVATCCDMFGVHVVTSSLEMVKFDHPPLPKEVEMIEVCF